MDYQIKHENLKKVYQEMKLLIEIEKDDRSPKIVRDAALNSYSAIFKTLRLLELPANTETKPQTSKEV